MDNVSPSENMVIWEQVSATPEEAKKTITGGRLKGMTNIQPVWRYQLLTKMFGPCGIGWKVEVKRLWFEPGAPNEICAFAEVWLYIQWNSQWSDPIPGIGGASFVTNERNGVFVSDECYKMAITDAISVCCKYLGFSADIYLPEDRNKYSEPDPTQGGYYPQPNPTQGGYYQQPNPTQGYPPQWNQPWDGQQYPTGPAQQPVPTQWNQQSQQPWQQPQQPVLPPVQYAPPVQPPQYTAAVPQQTAPGMQPLPMQQPAPVTEPAGRNPLDAALAATVPMSQPRYAGRTLGDLLNSGDIQFIHLVAGKIPDKKWASAPHYPDFVAACQAVAAAYPLQPQQ